MSALYRRHSMLALIVTTVLAAASPVPAFAEESHQFAIETTDAARAIHNFGTQSGIQILASAQHLTGKKLNDVSGTHSTDEGLKILLAGTGLTHRYVGERTVALLEADEGGSDSSARRAREGKDISEELRGSDNVEAGRRLDADPHVDSLEEILVTGTMIRGEAPVGSSMKVYTQEDFDRSGAATVDDFARTLNENFSNVDQLANTNAAVHRFAQLGSGTNNYAGSAFNLRGLGASSTLTLLNGARLAPAGQNGEFVDSSLIPLSAIERIEVLTDGASAIYGADAIAGVVNLIPRRDFGGLEARAHGGASENGGGARYGGSLIGGRSWSSGNALLSYQYNKQEDLDVADRPYLGDMRDSFALMPQFDTSSVFLSGGQDLGTAVRLSGHALHSRRKSALDNTTELVLFNQVDLTTSNADVELTAGAVGLDWQIGAGWTTSVRGSYSRMSQDLVTHTNSAVGATSLQIDGTTNAKSDYYGGDALVNGNLFSLPAGAVKLAVGASYREETFSNGTLGTFIFPGLPPASSSTQSGELDRQVTSFFSEAKVPVYGDAATGKGMELSAAVRRDEYDDKFGGATTWKGGLSWRPVSQLQVRATYGTSFRAPLLTQLGAISSGGVRRGFFANDPAPTIALSGGNGAIDAERSTSFGGGFDFEPAAVPGLGFSATYFSIDFEDKIGNPGAGQFGTRTDNPQLIPFILTNPSLAHVQELYALPGFRNICPVTAPCAPNQVVYVIDLRTTNLGAAKQEGVDVDTRYRFDSDAGNFVLTLKATHLMRNSVRLQANGFEGDYRDVLGQPVSWRGRGAISWSRNGANATLSVSHIDSYRLGLGISATNPLGSDVRIGSWTTADLSLSWTAAHGSAAALFHGLTLGLVVSNLADKEPPRVVIPSSLNTNGLRYVPFDAANASPMGRYFSVNVTKSW